MYTLIVALFHWGETALKKQLRSKSIEPILGKEKV